MEKPTAYLMIGIPGSGKSTWIKQNLPGVEVISRDIIRHNLGYTKSPDGKAVLSKSLEGDVTDIQDTLISHTLSKGCDIVIDDMNTGKYRKKMIDKLRSNGARVVAVRMNTPLATCIKRREGQIPSEIMEHIQDKVITLNPSDVDEIIDVPDNTNE